MPQVYVATDGIHVEDYCKREIIEPAVLELEFRELFAEELVLETSRRELARQVGLVQQSLNTPVERSIQETIVSACYEKLEGKDYQMWRKFLPTVNSSDVVRSYLEGYPKPWSDYNFDSVPIEVLAKIKQAKYSQLFTRLEIWSPEKTSPSRRHQIDPMAVGVIEHSTGRIYYQIVRWGEALLPVKTIKRRVRYRSLPTILNLGVWILMLATLVWLVSFLIRNYGLEWFFFIMLSLSIPMGIILVMLNEVLGLIHSLTISLVKSSSNRTKQQIKKILL